jgi:hypothetical protein
VGTASYRERTVETAVDHLAGLSGRFATRWFYLSQDSVAPKTLVRLAEAISDRGLDLRWATDLKPEHYLTAERARILRRGGGVACALGVESAAPRVLQLIDKGAPISTVRETIHHLAGAGLAVEAMCFTDFPTETCAEALATLHFLEELRHQIALYIVGEFDLTEGALVAKEPARFGLEETFHLDGDLLKTGLFYEEARPAKRGSDHARVDAALDRLSKRWRLRRYPWAGALSTAHTVFYYERFGPGVFRELAASLPVKTPPFGRRTLKAAARFDLAEVVASDDHELEIWRVLVRERRQVSRTAYLELAARAPRVFPRQTRYRVISGELPVRCAERRGRRPSNAPNASG